MAGTGSFEPEGTFLSHDNFDIQKNDFNCNSNLTNNSRFLNTLHYHHHITEKLFVFSQDSPTFIVTNIFCCR